MELTITDTNFSNNTAWVFKLKDKDSNVFYIMNVDFYRKLKRESPITKKHLDYYDKGTVIQAETKEYEAKKVVVDILE
jgi:hypothetical protein